MFAGTDWTSVLQLLAVIALFPVLRRLKPLSFLLRLVQRG